MLQKNRLLLGLITVGLGILNACGPLNVKAKTEDRKDTQDTPQGVGKVNEASTQFSQNGRFLIYLSGDVGEKVIRPRLGENIVSLRILRAADLAPLSSEATVELNSGLLDKPEVPKISQKASREADGSIRAILQYGTTAKWQTVFKISDGETQDEFLLEADLRSVTPGLVCKRGLVYLSYKVDGGQSYFLIRSEKIRQDLGPMAMPPFAAAFSSENEAREAQEKYSDGTVVKGFGNATKK